MGYPGGVALRDIAAVSRLGLDPDAEGDGRYSVGEG
jgi:hypothetical protein